MLILITFLILKQGFESVRKHKVKDKHAFIYNRKQWKINNQGAYQVFRRGDELEKIIQ